MDALVPAFVAALFAAIGGRPARLAARGGALAGIVLGHALGIVIGIAGAVAVAPLLAPAARALLLALALILAGLNGLWHRARPEPAGRAPFLTAAAVTFVAGEATAFLAFAFAVSGSAPVLAGAGALAGALVPAVVAAAIAQDWHPRPALNRAVGGMMVVGGIITALGGLRLL